jgi:hypothetical protein
MSMDEEHLKVLKMIQEGKITPEEGAQLLEALDETTGDKKTGTPNNPASVSNPARYFRVRITDTDTGKTRTNIRLPLTMINAGIRLGMKFSPQVEGLNLDDLKDLIATGETGQIVDVYDDDDGERVEVFIE